MAREVPHGTVDGYTNHGCRCESCKEARRAYDRERWRGSRKTVPAGEVLAIVGCLVAFGVPEARVARAVFGRSSLTHLRSVRHVRAKTAERVAELHWNLWKTHGPFREHCRCDVPYEVLDSLEAAS